MQASASMSISSANAATPENVVAGRIRSSPGRNEGRPNEIVVSG
jgi:hypothetical protein